jgi:hypothetical protein
VQSWAFKDVSNAYAEGFGFQRPDVKNINRWKRGLQVRAGKVSYRFCISV